MIDDNAWWGEDVVPRIRWKIPILRLAEAQEIPNGYGIAYYEPQRAVAIAMPIPINLIVGLWQSFMWHVRCPPWRHTAFLDARIMEARGEAFEKGFHGGHRRAHRDGYDLGRADSMREIAAIRYQNEQLLNVAIEATSMVTQKLYVIENGVLKDIKDIT